MPSEFNEQKGKWEHYVRQSDLIRFGQCADSHRRHMLDPESQKEGDAAILGTAAHAAYAFETEQLRQGKEASFNDTLLVAKETLVSDWRTAEAAGKLRQMQIPTLDDALELVGECVIIWWDEVLPSILAGIDDVNAVEREFTILVYQDNHREVYLQGTYDLGIGNYLWDYKHSNSQKYTLQKKWELDRYHPQPIHYSWAVDQMANPDLLTLDYPHNFLLTPDFTFININPYKGTVDWIPMEPKTVGDCFFHLHQIKGLVMMIENGSDEVWPLGATDWWCSSKWCDHWKDCRGNFIGHDPWGLLEKVEINLTKKREA